MDSSHVCGKSPGTGSKRALLNHVVLGKSLPFWASLTYLRKQVNATCTWRAVMRMGEK